MAGLYAPLPTLRRRPRGCLRTDRGRRGCRVEVPVTRHLPQSGRIEARTGLRMMPTSPRSPLSFRTAGFPQYGWKDGVSDGAFPTRRSVQACSRHTLTTYWFASVRDVPASGADGVDNDKAAFVG